MEDALMDMALQTPEMDEIIQLILDYKPGLPAAGAPARLAGGRGQLCDDWAPGPLLISPATFRRYFKRVTPKCMPCASNTAL